MDPQRILDMVSIQGRIPHFPYHRKDEWFLPFKLFNCFGAKNNQERIFSWQKVKCFPWLTFLSKLAFCNQERKLLKVTERVAQKNINATLGEIKGSNNFTKCGISIDGTWQRSGYSSLNGYVATASNLDKLEWVQLYAASHPGLRNRCPRDLVLYEADLQPLTLRSDIYWLNNLPSSSVTVTSTEPLFG
ncbi:hypothetical protein TNIN_430351 [Trichonephila inaurata madagascariensis]|uniref:Uncharacterized protein n=1 Tax=Trichonephila inaurata madagascariensis TaxID=2747483 RepID=A0A8X6Y9N3_9ARAC|nr:hypothetical protein TNIN_430351 [Trichonephila inaurata madagascariensis]